MPADVDTRDDLLARPLVAVANATDARTTADALAPYDVERLAVVTVVEKAGGAPDKAPMAGVEAEATEAFELLRERFDDVETDLRYGTDVVETVLGAARDHDATAIVFTPRPGNRLVRFLTGDVALKFVTEADRPVVSLPAGEKGTTDETDTGHGENDGPDTDRA
jgi:nucleotide-binding universal stress UspA family protein